MIYYSTLVILETSIENAWNSLTFIIENPPINAEMITEQPVISQRFYDGFTRDIAINGENIEERVYILKEQGKVVIKLLNHPVYCGETIFQIISPDDVFLSDKKTALAALMVWRIHPGMVEAPIHSYNPQNYVTTILDGVKKHAEGIFNLP